MTDPDNLRYTKLALSNEAGAIPALGFGTLISDPIATRNATKAALEAGFRALDTAERYRTEKEVGEAMHEVFKAGKTKREDVFVSTKLWNTNHRPERVMPAFEASLKKLQLGYLDLYLIHTPFAFQPRDVQDPRDANGNVIYDKGVTLLETWGDDPVISSIAKRFNKTPAQVLLAWAVQRGTALLTTSKTPSRIKENFDISTLPEDAMKEISEGIKTRQRFNAVVEIGVPGFIARGK
jgi:diketogulonate reductase-like aldo/keto reductase